MLCKTAFMASYYHLLAGFQSSLIQWYSISATSFLQYKHWNPITVVGFGGTVERAVGTVCYKAVVSKGTIGGVCSRWSSFVTAGSKFLVWRPVILQALQLCVLVPLKDACAFCWVLFCCCVSTVVPCPDSWRCFTLQNINRGNWGFFDIYIFFLKTCICKCTYLVHLWKLICMFCTPSKCMVETQWLCLTLLLVWMIEPLLLNARLWDIVSMHTARTAFLPNDFRGGQWREYISLFKVNAIWSVDLFGIL